MKQIWLMSERGNGHLLRFTLGFGGVAGIQQWRVAHHPLEPGYAEVIETEISQGRGPDGIVVMMPPREGALHEEAMSILRLKSTVICVDYDVTAQGIPSVILDQQEIGRMAARHLIDRGFSSLAVFGWDSHDWGALRIAGFRDEIKAAKRKYLGHSYRFAPGDCGWSDSDQVLWQRGWTNRLGQPVGVFALCDAWARYFASVCLDIKKRIPQDVAIVGVDDDPLNCKCSVPYLSSVVVHWDQIGHKAGLLMTRLLAGQTPPQMLVSIKPCMVAVRQSSDAFGVNDPDLTAALTYITNNAHRPIGPRDILRHVPVGRKRLEQAFRTVLGRSMLEEIRRVRVERAKPLLLETELSMTEIAEQCGFANATKLGIAFRSEVGEQPTHYRRSHQPPRV